MIPRRDLERQPQAFSELVQKYRRPPVAARGVKPAHGCKGRKVQAEPGFEAVREPGTFLGFGQQLALGGHAGLFGQPAQGRVLAAQFIHQAELQGLLAGKDLAAGQPSGPLARHVPPLGHNVHELLVHVLEHAFKIGPILG